MVEPHIGSKIKYFFIRQQALDFQDWMDKKHPECSKRAGYSKDKRMWYVEWICSQGWYEKAGGRRVYY